MQIWTRVGRFIDASLGYRLLAYFYNDSLHYEKFPDGTVKCIEDEIPFELPEGWEWCNLSMIGQTNIGLTYHPTDITSNGIMVLRSSNIVNGKLDLKDLVRVNTTIRDNQYVENNDILICARNGSKALVGKCTIIKNLSEKASFGAFMAIYRTQFYEYIYYFLNSNLFREIFFDSNSTTINQLTQAMIKSSRIPLPPLQEQKRIIAKLNKLFSFIDTIESNKTDLQSTIQLTKSKILDLAIRGKLIPQDPNDEPASVLLERIRAEKEELIKQGKIKRDKKESVIFRGEDNSYYLKISNLTETLDDWKIDNIPDSWGVCCLGEVCDYGNCTNVDTKDIPETAWILDLEDIEKDTGKVLQKLTLKERSSASTKHLFHKGQVLYSKLRPYLNKVVLADDDGYCTSEILPLEFSDCILPEYVKFYVMSPAFLRYANHCSYGVKMPRLGTLDGKKAVLTVPPINEQKRIADKVSQLFSILDTISASLD